MGKTWTTRKTPSSSTFDFSHIPSSANHLMTSTLTSIDPSSIQACSLAASVACGAFLQSGMLEPSQFRTIHLYLQTPTNEHPRVAGERRSQIIGTLLRNQSGFKPSFPPWHFGDEGTPPQEKPIQTAVSAVSTLRTCGCSLVGVGGRGG
jgi:hypothetical protein